MSILPQPMRALDELLNSWRANPDADATLAVCAYLGTSKREDLIREVGASAETWHARDAKVMLGVGRMFLDADMLQEAQTSFVLAGKADARDWRAFRYLGEVLLRRGDALRAEKVLARALQLGGTDDDVELWHERSIVYSALQKRVGPQAVASEVARGMPRQPSLAPAPSSGSLPSFSLEERTQPRQEAPAQQLSDSDLLEEQSAPRPLNLDDLRSAVLPPPRGARKPTPDPSAALANPFLPSQAPPTKPTVAGPNAVRRPRAATQVGGFRAPTPSKPLPAVAPGPVSKPTPPTVRRIAASDAEPVDPAAFEDAVTVVTPPPFQAQTAPAAAAPLPPLPSFSPADFAPAAPQAAASLSAPPTLATPPAPPRFAAPLPVAEPPASFEVPTGQDAVQPPPALVLAHLASVGVYEPGGGAAPAWERPPHQKTRGALTILLATLLVGSAGGGAYFYAKQMKEERARQASALNAEVDKLLKTANPKDLRATDERLRQAFELDSRSLPAARLWLQNRVLGALLLPSETRGIDSAVHRGRQVGLPEKDLAVGKVASFLVEGDVAGGAALLARADKDSGRDAHYQLAAGAVLERAGDPRAVERYQVAASLAPDLVPAQLLLARLLLLEGRGEDGQRAIDELAKRTGDTAITRALRALAWVLSPNRPEELPQAARLAPGDAEKLPAPLLPVPAMVQAAEALAKQDAQAASKAIDSAINLAMTPALATALGFLAIEGGDEITARRAALRALQFSAVYPGARTLAARVALLGGRIDEAQKAIEGLDPTSADVAIVRAVVAYESLEPADLKSALEALGNTAVSPAFAALETAPAVLRGGPYPAVERLEELALPGLPWGELVAVDAALDTGNLKLAESLLGKRSPESLRPVHLRRMARLKRLQGKLDESLAASQAAAEGGMSLPLLLERSYALLDKGDAAASKALVAKYAALLGPLAGWLSVLNDVASDQGASAAVRLSKLEPPPDESPATVKILVTRALVAARDKRAKSYATALLKQMPKNPDALAAASADQPDK